MASGTYVVQERSGTKLTVSNSTQNYNLGEFITDVNILPYIKSETVRVTASGLKPNTQVYVFVNDEDINAWFVQTNSSFLKTGSYGNIIVTGKHLYRDWETPLS